MTVSEFSYAALLYPDGSPTDSGFVAGTLADEKLTFSFTRPENPNGDFTLEILAFKGTEKTAFSRATAILSGSAPVKVGTADTITISKPVPLEVNPSYTGTKGTVSLNVRVPDGCTLEIDDTENFAIIGTSPNFTVTHNDDGIAVGAHPLTLTVKKGGSPLYVLSEHINVLPGLETNTWSGCKKGEPRVINEESFSTTVYVRGTGGWYEGSPYASTATASENNFGSFLAPLDTIQKAVDKVLAMNAMNDDGSREYTIYVDGELTCVSDTYTGANGMADFSALDKDLTLTIKALSGTATLDAGARFVVDESGNVSVSNAGIGKRVMYANPASGTLNLTLENLTITGGNTTGSGGGIYVNNGTLILQSGTISGNMTSSSTSCGGGVYVVSGSAFTMEGGKISGNTATLYGGGVYVGSSGTVTMSGGVIAGNKAEYGGGVFVGGNSIFTMESGTISGNEAIGTSTTSGGGGVYLSSGTFTMSDTAKISGNTAAQDGGGVYVTGSSSKFEMTGGTIGGSADEKNTASQGGGVCAKDKATFTMSGGAINANEATLYGGVYLTGSATFTMGGGEISGNKATSSNSNGGGGVLVGSGSTFTMISGTISLNTTQVYGGGVYVSGGNFNMSGGTIDDNMAKYGGGVYVSNGTFNMSGNATISGNTADYNGGGVYVNSGTFTMEGGTIKRNKTTSTGTTYGKGGGIFVSGAKFEMSGTATISDNTATGLGGGGVHVQGSSGTFNMSGGTISNNIANGTNTSAGGGGVYINTGSTFTMSSNATISGNTATNNGGGVYVTGSGSTFTMNAGTIGGTDSNTAKYAGGVYVASTGEFTMEGGEISKNKATISGGGVYVTDNDSKFNMNNGTIDGNTATNYGGGVYVTTNGKFTMKGGTIGGSAVNNALYGGGVYLGIGTFTMSGSATVSENNDVRFANQQTITVAGAPTAASPVATITPSSYAEGTQVLSASGVTLTQAICDKFTLSDDSWTIAPSADGTQGVLKEKIDTVYLNSSTGADTNSGTSASAAVATLLRAMRLSAKEIIVCATYTLPSDEANLLDRSGGGKLHLTLSRYESFTGNMLEIDQGNVTISNITLDGNKDKVSASGFCLYVSGSSTTVTFGSAAVARNNKTGQRGSGVYINSGTFKMTNGSLVDGNQASYGGGVYVNDNGIFEMSGGVISGNMATVSGYGGGGAYVRGTVKMSGGEISGNTASYGGGAYVASAGGGTFTMTGGKITGNTATSQGGGVYVTGKFTIEGGEITGNTAASSGNGVSGSFTKTGGTVQAD